MVTVVRASFAVSDIHAPKLRIETAGGTSTSPADGLTRYSTGGATTLTWTRA